MCLVASTKRSSKHSKRDRNKYNITVLHVNIFPFFLSVFLWVNANLTLWSCSILTIQANVHNEPGLGNNIHLEKSWNNI